MPYSRLLINEYPLMVLPHLAEAIGLNEAIILQQFHYWLQSSKNVKDGHHWIYNTYDGWQRQFPFWSKMTVRRAITSLENKKLIVQGKRTYNKYKFDKTKWYRIDYGKLQSVNRRCVQNEQTRCSNRTDGSVQNEQNYTRDYPETTSETSKYNKSSSGEHDHTSAKKVISYLNKKANKKYRNTATNYRVIEPRLKDYSVDDLKHVVDVKCSQWLGTDMDKYLRPQTLFRASKFEGYLNEKIKGGNNHGQNKSYGDINF